MVLDRHHTSMNSNRRAVGVFSNRRDAENALHELKASGFDMNRVSVITRDAHGNQEIEGAEVTKKIGNKADEGAGAGALSGGALGGLTGLLVGLGTLAIPGIGPVMLAGEVATALATTAAGAAIGAASGGLIGGLVGLGIPEKEAKAYSDRVHQGDYLVIVDGTDEEIRRAETALNHANGLQDWATYDHPNAGVTASAPTTSSFETESRVHPTPVVDHTIVDRPNVDVDRAHDDAIRLYEERLIVDKDREKTGEVSIGKHIETETARVSVPIEKERVVIERVTPSTSEPIGDDAFRDSAVRMEVYEETPDIQKEAFVREEVTVRKEVTEETVAVQETLRREEIDVVTDGNAVVDRDLNQR
ncbi:signal transduction histidine kinase, LytS [Leptolyngbya sp. NIES-3755]|nr:signal transduction histidine kinase, LytS [Leptolyngbya sp. NIES-3755]